MELTPAQIIICLVALGELMEQEPAPKVGRPEDFLAMLGRPSEHVEIVRV